MRLDKKLWGSGSTKGSRYPSKTTMNMAQAPEPGTKLGNMVVYGILAVLLLVLVGRFAIYDQYAAAAAAESQAAGLQQQAEQLRSGLADYQAVSDGYARYSYGYQDETEASLVDRLQMLDTVDRYVAPFGTVSSVTIADNTASITLSSPTLDDTGALVSGLKKLDSVSDVSVNTATAQSGASSTVIITVVISFQRTSTVGAGVSSGSTVNSISTSGTGA